MVLVLSCKECITTAARGSCRRSKEEDVNAAVGWWVDLHEGSALAQPSKVIRQEKQEIAYKVQEHRLLELRDEVISDGDQGSDGASKDREGNDDGVVCVVGIRVVPLGLDDVSEGRNLGTRRHCGLVERGRERRLVKEAS